MYIYIYMQLYALEFSDKRDKPKRSPGILNYIEWKSYEIIEFS